MLTDVVLIYPSTGMDFASTIAPPHGLLAIAAPLHKEGYRIKIIDQRVDKHWKRHLIQELKGNPICVGISTMTGTQIHFALKAAKAVKRYNYKIPIVWGGPHPSTMPQQTCQNKYVDVVCVGEGDITFMEIVKALERRLLIRDVKGIVCKEIIYFNATMRPNPPPWVITTPPRPLLDVEKLLPVPWELIDVENYIHRDMYLKSSSRTLDVGQTSRGCPYQCAYCSSAAIRQRKWRAMSVEKALQVVIDPVERFGLTGIWIRDDEFFVNSNRANGICKGMIKAGLNIRWYTSGTRVDTFNRLTDEQIAVLKESGASVLKFGAESGSNRMLNLIKKGIAVEEIIECNLRAKKHGITPAFALMMGFPTETFEEINQTIDLAIRLKNDNPSTQFEALSPYTALPGTEMYDVALQHGLKPPSTLEGWVEWDFEKYDKKGNKVPWFNYTDRKKIGNIAYMWILSNAVQNAINGITNPTWRYVIKLFATPIGRYFRSRIRRKSYNFVPELFLFKFVHGFMVKARIVLR